MAIGMGDEAVKTYLPLIQGVISRMAANSANCKTWCVTIVAALFALAIDKGKPDSILIGLLPLGLFCWLDAYYLSLEWDFRQLHKGFVQKLRGGTAVENDLYVLNPADKSFGQRVVAVFKQFASFSVWPFYGMLLATLLITYFLIKPAGPTTTRPAEVPAATSSPASK
jgi:hypothetical protein